VTGRGVRLAAGGAIHPALRRPPPPLWCRRRWLLLGVLVAINLVALALRVWR
jgi:hypothetical protein